MNPLQLDINQLLSTLGLPKENPFSVPPQPKSQAEPQVFQRLLREAIGGLGIDIAGGKQGGEKDRLAGWWSGSPPEAGSTVADHSTPRLEERVIPADFVALAGDPVLMPGTTDVVSGMKGAAEVQSLADVPAPRAASNALLTSGSGAVQEAPLPVDSSPNEGAYPVKAAPTGDPSSAVDLTPPRGQPIGMQPGTPTESVATPAPAASTPAQLLLSPSPAGVGKGSVITDTPFPAAKTDGIRADGQVTQASPPADVPGPVSTVLASEGQPHPEPAVTVTPVDEVPEPVQLPTGKEARNMGTEGDPRAAVLGTSTNPANPASLAAEVRPTAATVPSVDLPRADKNADPRPPAVNTLPADQPGSRPTEPLQAEQPARRVETRPEWRPPHIESAKPAQSTVTFPASYTPLLWPTGEDLTVAPVDVSVVHEEKQLEVRSLAATVDQGPRHAAGTQQKPAANGLPLKQDFVQKGSARSDLPPDEPRSSGSGGLQRPETTLRLNDTNADGRNLSSERRTMSQPERSAAPPEPLAARHQAAAVSRGEPVHRIFGSSIDSASPEGRRSAAERLSEGLRQVSSLRSMFNQARVQDFQLTSASRGEQPAATIPSADVETSNPQTKAHAKAENAERPAADLADSKSTMRPASQTFGEDHLGEIFGRQEIRMTPGLPRPAEARTLAQVIAQPRLEGVVDQVARGFRFSLENGRSEVTLQLKPESLGAIRMRLAVEQGVVHAVIEVENAEVQRVLEKSLHTLGDRLAEQGYRLDRAQITIDNSSAGRQAPIWGSQHGHSYPGKKEQDQDSWRQAEKQQRKLQTGTETVRFEILG